MQYGVERILTMLQCQDTLRLVSREFEMSDEFWETALLPYNEFVLGGMGLVD